MQKKQSVRLCVVIQTATSKLGLRCKFTLFGNIVLKPCFFSSTIVNGIDGIVGRLNSDQCNKNVVKQGKMAFQMSLFGNII